MKNILIFRSAKDSVMNLLMNSLPNNATIYGLLQKKESNTFCEKYPEMKIIQLSKSYYEYNDFREKVELNNLEFDEVYIPVSGKGFSTVNEIQDILYDINYEECIFFDCEGSQEKVKKAKKQRKIDVFFISILYYLMTAVHSFKYKTKLEEKR